MRHAARAHTVTHPAQRDAFETPHPQRQRAARFDVARPAGVSTAVVSYVLNGSPKIISPDTAQRVFDAAQRLAGVSVNALGYAGSLFAASPEKLRALAALDLVAGLCTLGWPRAELAGKS